MNPETEQRLRDSFSRQRAMALIGSAITHMEDGQVRIEMPFRTDLTQQHGFIHAGVVTMLVDTACGYAALSLMPPEAAVLTVEYKVNFLSPAAGQSFIASGRVLKPGRTLMACYGEVHAQTAAGEKLVASMLATMIVREGSGLLG